jgi:hypothetical protein
METIIYVVMSRELLANDEYHTETCRAFDNEKDALKLVEDLKSIMFGNNTQFYIEETLLGGL